MRKKKFDSLCRALSLPGDNSEETDVKRAMIALCHGENLVFEQIDPKLLRFLGYVGDCTMPTTAYDLLPPSMEQHHRQWVAKSIKFRQLPDRLSHPLRSVDVKHASGHYMRMDLIIEWVPDAREPVFQLVFASVDPSSVYQLQTLSTGEQVQCPFTFKPFLLHFLTSSLLPPSSPSLPPPPPLPSPPSLPFPLPPSPLQLSLTSPLSCFRA
jgi:hypothetical protein